MTHSILTTDIELAKKLLTAARPDGAIIAALVSRGIDSASAAQLVNDLRNGRQVTPTVPAGLEMSTSSSRRHSRSRRESRRKQPQSAARSSESAPHAERAHERHSDARKNSSTLWLLAAVPICFVAVIVGVLISNHLRRAADEEPQKNVPTAGAVTAPSSGTTSNALPPKPH
jgi:hypothetical protein